MMFDNNNNDNSIIKVPRLIVDSVLGCGSGGGGGGGGAVVQESSTPGHNILAHCT